MKKFSCFFLSLLPVFSFAQNLVINPGFDEFQETRWSTSTLEHCTGWLNPSLASPDYFNPSLNHHPQMVHPKNWWGYQTPKSGNANAGFIAYRSHGDKKNSEYIEARLTQALVAGEEYKVEFSLSLAECSSLSLSEMGAYFSDKEVFMKTVYMLKYKPQLVLPLVQCDTASWATLSATYKAKGGEQFMVIGFFDYDQRIRLEKETPSANISDPRNEAYYFIDDVSVTPLKAGLHHLPGKDSVVLPVKEKPELVFDTKKPFVLEHILFETGKDLLMPSSFNELEDLAQWLNKNPDIHAEINGYTDADGPADKNLELSKKRAKAVYSYLIQKGILPGRLIPQGFGELNPRAGNDTEQGKALNRRVEFKVIG